MAVIGMIWAQAHDAEGRPVIGARGGMPWRLPEDMRHFREVTDGHPVVMGRRTWESLPARFRPLPGRANVVVTRNAEWTPEPSDGVAVAASLGEALALASAPSGSETAAGDHGLAGVGQVPAEPAISSPGPKAGIDSGSGRKAETWVIGGGQLYAEALAVADRCVVTEIDLMVEGDTYAPALDDAWVAETGGEENGGEWRTSSSGLQYRFLEYRRAR